MTAAVPLVVDLEGRRVIVVGGGPVAAAKMRPLLDAGADVHVVAPHADDAVREAAGRGRLSWSARPYERGDLGGAFLAVAATADPATNARVAADAAEQATFCVRTDRAAEGAEKGTAALPGIVRRGELLLAVSTGGRAPAVARHVRSELDAAYGPEYGALVALLGELREAPETRAVLDARGSAARRAAWRSLPMADILSLLRSGDHKSARELALACLSSSSD